MDALTIAPDTAVSPGVAALLHHHFETMRAGSPEDSCHVMSPDALAEADVILLSARMGEDVVGVGVLKPLDADHGELKSMHTAHHARGQGVGRAILDALIDTARNAGLSRLSLETGSDAAFAPARALYVRAGFDYCDPFSDYRLDPFSVYMTRSL